MTKISPISVRVDVHHHHYDIQIGSGLLSQAGALIQPHLRRPRLIIISDESVWAHHGKTLESVLKSGGIDPHVFKVAAGEASKSLASFSQLCDDILAIGVERKDVILAFGGGVIGDLAGYVAASLLRGIPYIQWPTTLLSQVDSSVGGKTGINAKHGKNLIGAFYQPQAVFIDTDLLRTLSPREWRAGYAEVIKYGLLGNAEFFDWLEAEGPTPDDSPDRLDVLVHAIATSCQCKADIVRQDEKETGVRGLLNLGHTFGHALEASYGYDGRLIHGEAVAVGMGMAYRLAKRLGSVDGQEVVRVERMLERAGLPLRRSQLAPQELDVGALMDAMSKDKKAKDGRLVFIVPTGIGTSEVRSDVPHTDVEMVLADWLSS